MEKLIDFILSCIGLFKFWFVIRQWEKGIVLTFGTWTGKTYSHGVYFMWPFCIDEVHTIDIIPTVAELDSQTIVTSDKTVVVVQALIKYEVVKPEICLIDVANETDAVKEFTQGAIHSVIVDIDYKTANVKEIEKRVKELAQKEINKWGIKVHSVVIKSFGKMSTIRLMNS